VKTLVSIFIAIFGLSAKAHLKVGTYQGQTPQGQACTMQITNVYMENNQQHPLNERAQIQIGAKRLAALQFTVQHPPVIDLQSMTAAFNHDMFTGIIPTAVGANALVVKMVHETNFEGPTEFHLVQHEYKANKRSLVSCLNIKLVSAR
jgi:hypothetical protein